MSKIRDIERALTKASIAMSVARPIVKASGQFVVLQLLEEAIAACRDAVEDPGEEVVLRRQVAELERQAERADEYRWEQRERSG